MQQDSPRQLQPTDPPVFGDRVDGCPYVVRPSAYALVRNLEGEIALVRTRQGCFLPGGGIETDERPEKTVEREAKEECGLLVDVRSALGKAVEIVHSIGEATCFEKRSEFFEADMTGSTTSDEEDHELLWLSPDRAIEVLSHESHRWAVRRLVERTS